MKLGFDKKVIIKSQRQFMYGSNFYGSDVSQRFSQLYPLNAGLGIETGDVRFLYELVCWLALLQFWKRAPHTANKIENKSVKICKDEI